MKVTHTKMKETYYLTSLDYWLIMRMIDSAWNSKRPRQLEHIHSTIYNKHHLTRVKHNVDDILETITL